MAIFRLKKDTKTSDHAGAGGMFQIEHLELDDVDVTDRVDQGRHFSEEDSKGLVDYLSNVFKIPAEHIEFEQEGMEDWPFK